MRPIESAKANTVLPKAGTSIRIAESIKPPSQCEGFFVKKEYISNRRPGEIAEYAGWVAGAGGDVWWIRHGDGTIGAYEFTEIFDV